MAHVTVSINGRNYQVACDDGQEAHLTRLGSYVDNRVQELVAAVGQAGDARLLVMVSLLLADELSDAYSELETIRKKSEGVARIIESEEKVSQMLEKIADRIETVAQDMEQA
ncbi:MAG: cell division protein ZapA [Rhodospirillaceae bacterium]